ncbi:MAG: MotA/TolQ/ExbB proton channel family protein [Burkholderiales bacterium]|nr:MotA/TolQ/ExbB proton channel family protein [Burkholderiales bacterium]
MDNLFSSHGWSHFWAQSDAVGHFIAWLLLAMSICSWFFIISKSLAALRTRHSAHTLHAFWAAATLADGVALLQRSDSARIFSPLAQQALQLEAAPNSLAANLSRQDLSTRLLRQHLQEATLKMERGLTVLASIGATAPFVGLLGTVLGIYHSLSSVTAAGGAQIDKLAGPVGEALIMTALGLAVAIPAVLAYNGLNRINRVNSADLEGFAYDLQAYLQYNQPQSPNA